MTKTAANPQMNDKQSAPRPIVVGVDGSMKNAAALTWAAAEAERARLPLQLLMVSEKQNPEQPPYSPVPPSGPVDYAYRVLDRQATKLMQSHPDLEVTTDVRVDDPRGGLVTASKHAEMVVVGKRGLGAFKRMMLGSTSIEVAGRSMVPVIVVPNSWHVSPDDRSVILVGIDIDRDCNALLDFAFRRAEELRAPLLALHSWDIHPSVGLSADDRAAWGKDVQRSVATTIAPWQRRHPEVHALAAQRHAHAAQGLLDAAADAQLLVLGRHMTVHPHLGLGIGSVARTVMHYAKVPVAVIPTS